MKKRYRIKYRKPGIMDTIVGIFLYLVFPIFNPFDTYRWVIQEKHFLFWRDYVGDDGTTCRFETKEEAERYIEDLIND